MDPNRPGYFADDVRIHALIVMFPPLIRNHTLPMSVIPLSQNYVCPAREPATHLICYHPDLLQLIVLCSATSNDGFLLDPLCHTKVVQHGKPTEWSPNMNQICIVIHLHEHQYSRLGVVCAFVTGTYPNMKSGCYHHQIGIDYLYDAIFKMATSEVKLRFCL